MLQRFTMSPARTRTLWWVVMLGMSVVFTLCFQCATPLAALATAAVFTLPRRDVLPLMMSTWALNQAVGFLWLGYPWDAATLTWGAALGAVTALSALVALACDARFAHMPVVQRAFCMFAAGCVAYEAALYALSLWLGGVENFTLLIQGRVLAVNAGALLVLAAVHKAAATLRLVPAYAPVARR